MENNKKIGVLEEEKIFFIAYGLALKIEVVVESNAVDFYDEDGKSLAELLLNHGSPRFLKAFLNRLMEGS